VTFKAGRNTKKAINETKRKTMDNKELYYTIAGHLCKNI
jgi:hypothetical protein